MLLFPTFLSALIPSLASIGQAPQSAEPIKVSDGNQNGMHGSLLKYEWSPVEGGFRREDRFITSEEVAALRSQILATSSVPHDLLAQVGVTPASVQEHRLDILRAAWPEALRPAEDETPPLPSELDHLVSYEELSPAVVDALTGRLIGKRSRYELRIEIPGDPPITVESIGTVACTMPWTIKIPGSSWQCSDVSLSRSLMRLLDSEGASRTTIYGARPWDDGFWSDREFWSGVVGDKLDSALSERLARSMDGYAEAMTRYQLERIASGRSLGSRKWALMLTITARAPNAIDAARWWTPLEDFRPSSSWMDFISVHDAARSCVERHGWLLEWKNAGPNRTLELQAVGRTGYEEFKLETFVTPPWRDAGFTGDPEFEILLRREGTACGSVWLSSEEQGALITTMYRGMGDHWLDRQQVFFHPKEPYYGIVTAAGQFEARTIQESSDGK